MFRSVSLKVIALGAVALSGFALAPSDASADGWRHRGHGHHRGYYAPPPRAYYAPPPRAYYYAPPRYVYAPPPRPRHHGYYGGHYAPRPYYRY